MGLSYANLADIQALNTEILEACRFGDDEQVFQTMESLGIDPGEGEDLVEDFVSACEQELERRESQET